MCRVNHIRSAVSYALGFSLLVLGLACKAKADCDLNSPFGTVKHVVYIEFDSAGAWQTALGRELQAAGFNVDWNKLMAP